MITENFSQEDSSTKQMDSSQKGALAGLQADAGMNKQDVKSAPDSNSQSAALPDLNYLLAQPESEETNSLIDQQIADIYEALPDDQKEILKKAAPELLNDKELEAPFGEITQKALMRNADQFPPVKNPDGSMSYTLLQIGMTDRESPDGVNYFCRKVDVTVPAGAPSLGDCQFTFNDREMINEEKYNQLLEKEKAWSKDISFFTHGVSTDARNADKQALKLELSNGLPTVNIDWTANPAKNEKDPAQSLGQYLKDTVAAKRANDNAIFTGAIDKTIEKIGAENTSMIGFSHGGMFDTRYLKHRVSNHLPELDTVILTHPDLPIGSGELWNNSKPRVIGEAAEHSFVIGSRRDWALRMGMIVSHLPFGHPAHDSGNLEQRLGNYSFASRMFINLAGAKAVKEVNQEDLGTHHFLNYAGINQLLKDGELPFKQLQDKYNDATEHARQQALLSQYFALNPVNRVA